MVVDCRKDKDILLQILKLYSYEGFEFYMETIGHF